MVLGKSMAGMTSPPDVVSADARLLLHVDAADWWTVHRGYSPVLATAIHNGHTVRADIEALMAISAEERLREEDPFTEFVTRDVPNRIVFHRSRFEIDLNRPREGAVYLSPEQAWGLDIWKQRPAGRRNRTVARGARRILRHARAGSARAPGASWAVCRARHP